MLRAVAQFAVVMAALWQVGRLFGWTVAGMCFILLNSMGFIKIFPALYAIYTSRFGYYLKGVLHPRVAEQHSVCPPFTEVPGVTILPIAILANNYAYLVWCDSTKEAFVVDPADPEKVKQAIPKDVTLTHILTTHSHWDHAGGNVELNAAFDNKLVVVGGALDPPHGTTQSVADGDCLKIGHIEVDVLHGPGHTEGHVLFVVRREPDGKGRAGKGGPQAVFTGDAVFIGGAGAFFEGNCKSLERLQEKLRALDPSTYLFCGHEYTMTLLEQAVQMDPDNEELQQWLRENEQKRMKGLCTVPSTLAKEFATNPFLRVDRQWLSEAARAGLPSDRIYNHIMTKRKAE
eukprot:EG_transcript_13322